MKTKFLLLILLSTLLVSISCSRVGQIYNVPNQDVITNGLTKHTKDDVKKAILRAGAGLGWIMNSKAIDGHIIATLNIRVHMAKVDIRYDLITYSITYMDSLNLSYEASGSKYTDEDGIESTNENTTIHKNYNSWIKNLDRAIKAQLNIL